MPVPGTLLDQRYRLLRRLGAGGYGTVWLADELASATFRDELPGREGMHEAVLRQVAVKVLHGEQLGDSRRFLDEVTALCRLRHPGIVTVFHHGRDGSTPWVAMEYVEGRPLTDCGLAEDLPRLVRVFLQIAEALAHAHARGVVHRDLKPHNILLTRDDEPKLLDFGLSWLLQRDAPSTQRVGTPGYMAPELVQDEEAPCDHRADLYSLGATLHACLTGDSPFGGGSTLAVLRRQLENRWSFAAGFPTLLRPLVAQCLERDPACRPRSALAVADTLRDLCHTLDAAWGQGPGGDPWSAEGGLEPEGPRTHADLWSARVERVESFVHATQGEGVRLWLLAAEDLDGTRVTGGAAVRAFLYRGAPQSRSARLWEVASTLWPGAEVHVLGGELRQDRDGQPVVRVHEGSGLVVEPFQLVTVTEASRVDGVRAAPCPSRAQVDLRRNVGPATPALHAGTLLHRLLETLVQRGEAPCEDALLELLEELSHELRWELLGVGMTEAGRQRWLQDLMPHARQLADFLRQHPAWLAHPVAEARRLDTRWGLDGRMDLLVEDGETLRILELKTGAQSPEHDLQLRAYFLLWDAWAQRRGMRMEGTLLYTRDGTVRTLHPDPRRDRDLMAARNALVAMRRHQARGDGLAPPVWQQHPERCQDAPCRWLREPCQAQHRRLGHPAGLVQARALPTWWERTADERALLAWFFHWHSLVERESQAVGAQVGDQLRPTHRGPQTPDGGLLDEVPLALHPGLPPHQVRARCDARAAGLLAQDRVLLLGGRRIADRDLWFATVVDVQADHLVLAFPPRTPLDRLVARTWQIQREPVRSGWRDMQRALWTLLEHRAHDLGTWLVRPHALLPQLQPPDPSEAPADGLNAEQHRAALALAGPDPVVLVHGPPGTGKTEVIARAVARMVAQGQRVLLAACTNAAVDTMLARVVAAGVTGCLRVQSSRRTTDGLRNRLQEAGIDPGEVHSVDLARGARDLDALGAALDRVQVVAATCNACASSPVFQALQQRLGQRVIFDAVVVDEASQLMEPLALAAAVLARRVRMIGDERQLPPVVVAQGARSDALGETGAHADAPRAGGSGPAGAPAGLDRSLFERWSEVLPRYTLVRQYRMSEDVQRLPSRAFYGGRLVADGSVARRAFPLGSAGLATLEVELRGRWTPDRARVWVVGEGEAVGNTHAGEVEAIVATLAGLDQALRAEGRPWDPDLVGVISPFRAQCQALRQALRQHLGEAAAQRIEVDTVERFQGRQKEAMLVSLVRTGWSDFVMDARRLNVTLTRARSKVMIFGSLSLAPRLLEPLASGSGLDVEDDRPAGVGLTDEDLAREAGLEIQRQGA
jgi:DNA replication ATP-dependent helicase Dna2